MVTPKSSGRAMPNRRAPGSQASQPATEPPDQTVTERRRLVAMDGHVGAGEVARAGLADPAPAVRVTALGALERRGELQVADVVAALADPEPSVRRRACELAAGLPDLDVSSSLGDPDPSVVEMAAWALGERGSPGAVPALNAVASMASGHREPLCREAAVAALGAIGDPAGLPAVLGALEDKPAIRRRAAVALAAFSGPEVEAALRRCLEDRDWQVRQVAEDLLAVD